MEKEISYSLNAIEEVQAKEIIKNYLQKALQRSGGGKINETVSVWFPIKQLLDFAKLLSEEQQRGMQQQQQGHPNPKITDGVRVYFANYGNSNIPDLDPKYKNQNTLVLVSTYENGNNPDGTKKHKDYFVPHSQLPEKFLTPPENKGTLCPPDTGCGCDDILKGEPCQY